VYRDLFGLDDEPFRITPDPRFLHLDPMVEEALGAITGGIGARAGLIFLVGEVGTGKTTLLRRILDQIGDEVRTVLVLHPTVSFDEILDHVLLELGLPVASGGRDDLLARLAEFLRDHAHAGGNVAVFFDEAQALREETTQRFAEMEKAIQRNSEETRRNSEDIRYLGVRIEGLEGTIQTVAEGVVGNNERLDAFRGEVSREFKEVRATMQLHYRELDRRITHLEQGAAAKKVVKRAAKKASGKKAARGN